MRIGDTFGQLTVTELETGSRRATCRCECGSYTTPWRTNLITGKTTSCGQHRLPIAEGDTFGEWTVLSLTTADPVKVLVRCSCDIEKVVSRYSLLRGDSTSCGHPRLTGPRARLMNMWEWMISRTTNPADPMFRYYGERGIRVCDEWASNPDAYIDWAIEHGFKKNAGLQIDRIDNDGPYSPENCRVTTRVVNANNKSNNTRVSAFDDTRTVAQWAADDRCVVSYGTLWSRIRAGWDAETAITTPAATGRGRGRPKRG